MVEEKQNNAASRVVLVLIMFSFEHRYQVAENRCWIF